MNRRAQERNFSSDSNFINEYTHENRDTGEVFESPFPVTVLGVREEVLGVGQVIGGIVEDDGYVMPVIRIEDSAVPMGEVQLLGAECWWVAPVPEEVTELVRNHSDQITAASQYVIYLDSGNN